MPRVQRIIVGISGSRRSLPALHCAADLARAYEAELVPVHAWIPPLAAFAGYQFPSGHLRRKPSRPAGQSRTPPGGGAPTCRVSARH